MKQSPIFIKTYEMLVWLLQHTGKFPRNQHFLITKRLEDTALDSHERIHEAARNKRRSREALTEADVLLASLKVYGRLSKDLELLAFNPYEHLTRLLDELGRLLGGWQRSMVRRSTAAMQP